MGHFVTHLQAEKMTYNETDWKVTYPLIFYSEVAQCYINVEVEFITDFASVPRAPIVYRFCGGIGPEEATIHDWCYRKGLFTRKICDLIYLEALESKEWRSQLQCHVMYMGVVEFGGPSYKGLVDGYPVIDPREMMKPKKEK